MRPIDWLVAGVLLGAPLAFGSVHFGATLVVGLACLAALVLHLRDSTAASEPVNAGPLGTILLVSVGFSLFQLVPLPPAVHRLLSASAHESAMFGGELEGRWLPLAVEPAAAAQAALRRAACACLFLVAAARYARRNERETVYLMVAIAAATLAAVGLGRWVWALHAAPSVWPRFTSMFVNPNHLAGYLSLTAPIGLAIAVAIRSGWARTVAGGGGLLGIVGVLLSLSRGGIVSLAVAITALMAVMAVRSARQRDSRHTLLAVLMLILIAVAGAGALALGPLRERLTSLEAPARLTEDVKVRVALRSLDVIREHAVAGIGHDGFGPVLFRYWSGRADRTFTHVENEYLQQLVDQGAFGVIPAMAIALTAIAWLWRRRQKTSTAFVGAAFLALALHEVADFSLETGAVSATFFALLGTLAPRHGSRRTEGVRGRQLLPAAAALTGIATLAALALAPHTADRDVARIRAALPSGIDADARVGAAWHPLDFVPALVAADRLREAGDAKAAARWLNRALYLAPTVPATHLAASRLLLSTGHVGQALGEASLAYAQSADAERPALLAWAWSQRHRADDVLRLTGGDLEEACRAADVWFLQRGDRRAALAVFDAVLARDPGNLAGLTGRGQVLLALGRPAEAAAPLERAWGERPSKPLALMLYDLRRSLGKIAAAREALQTMLDVTPYDVDLNLALGEDALLASDWKTVNAAVARALEAGGHSRGDLARSYALQARAFKAAGRGGDALRAWERAAAMDDRWSGDASRFREELAHPAGGAP